MLPKVDPQATDLELLQKLPHGEMFLKAAYEVSLPTFPARQWTDEEVHTMALAMYAAAHPHFTGRRWVDPRTLNRADLLHWLNCSRCHGILLVYGETLPETAECAQCGARHVLGEMPYSNGRETLTFVKALLDPSWVFHQKAALSGGPA